MLTNKMVNPTHKDVKINWSRGINIRIPADGQIDLTHEQMDDFRPGKPGTEEVRNQTDPLGVFLLDGDKSYDEQALEALKKCKKAKEDQVRAFTERLRDSRIATGAPVDEVALQEAIQRSGYAIFQKDIEILGKRIKILEDVLNAEGHKGKVKEDIDPRRTCFATQPPREFPSETALAMFLVDKPEDFVEQHRKLQSAMLGK